MNDLIGKYLETWNETDPVRRQKLIAEVFAADAQYTDPLAEVRGRGAIDALIGAVQQQFPGFVFTPAGPVDAHHQQVRFTWGLGPDGAEPAAIGFDVAVTDEAGQIASVYGFLDKLPA
jgi:SnoaL-like domain